jgi:transposase-like protein
MKYTIKDFHKQFPDDSACLQFIFDTRWPNGGKCEKCGKENCFHAVTGRKSYACAWCGFQLSPTEGTIYHKSSTSLKSWFFAMYLMSTAKNGVAAKELERQLGVTYKTAWRMAQQIRKLMEPVDHLPVLGTVEADETYFGGKRRGKRGRGAHNKVALMGVLERKGNLAVTVTENCQAKTLMPIIAKHAAPGSVVCTDEFNSYLRLAKAGYTHSSVHHTKGEWVRGLTHTNGIDGFWSQLKRSIHGTFHHVSRHYLSAYVNEFVYRYNLRESESTIFEVLTRSVAEQHA